METSANGTLNQGIETTYGTSFLMLSFPHSGSIYPSDFGYDPSLPFNVIDFPSDKYVDELWQEGGALNLCMIKANFPRAYVDVNRHQHDIDSDLMENSESWYGRFLPGSKKTGSMLFWTKVLEQPMYVRKMSPREAKARIAHYFVPFHQSMTSMIENIREKYGHAIILDCHSMTQFDPQYRGGKERPQIDIGDRHGETCASDLSERIAMLFEQRGYEVGINRRFPGGEITLRYGWPEINQHIMQIEIRRDLYMNEETRQRSSDFTKVQADCSQVLREFKKYVEARSLNDNRR